MDGLGQYVAFSWEPGRDASVADTPSQHRSRVAVTSGAGAGVSLTHIGGPTVLVEVGGWRLLTDPTFDPPGKSYRFGWGTGSLKLTGPAIAALGLGPIDAVLLSHDHHDDNFGAAGRALLHTAGIVITTVPGAKRLGADARGLAPRATTRLEAPARLSIDITTAPSRHGPRLSRKIVGAVVGFALRWEGQEYGVLWISGDTVLSDGVRRVADRLRIGTALLHLGGVRFPIEPRVSAPMSWVRMLSPRARAGAREAVLLSCVPRSTVGGGGRRQGLRRDRQRHCWARVPVAVGSRAWPWK